MTPTRAGMIETGRTPLVRRLAGGFATFTSLMNSLGSVWVFCLMLLVCADVFGRTILKAPILGATEFLAYSIVGIVYLQIANTLQVGRFTRAEFVIRWLDRTRPPAGSGLTTLFDVVGMITFAVLAWISFPALESAWLHNEVDGAPGVFTLTLWPFRLMVVVGAASTAVVFAGNAVAAAAETWRRLRSALSSEGKRRTGWPVVLAFVVIVAAGWLIGRGALSNVEIAMLSVLLMLVMIGFGLHIGVALIVLGFFGIWLIRDNPTIAYNTFAQAGREFLRNHLFAVIPLFVMMGFLVSISEIGRETFDVARWSLRRIKGGLGVATVAANAVFAAITGTSIASAAVFTKIATPEMMRHGYTARFSVGVVAGSSVLGMLIPPSLLLIVYGFISEQSVGILFLAAVIPGLILAAAMGLGIVFMAVRMPQHVGGIHEDGDEETAESIRGALVKMAPIVALIVLVLGGIYGGVFTPTEAGAAGAAGALLIALARRRLDWPKLWQVLIETGHVTVAILFLILSANIYSRMIAMSGLPQHTSELIASAGLGFYGFMAVFIFLLIVLGMVLDSVSIMLITLPLALPVVESMGGNLIWFGIVSVIAVEIGLLTPPVGLTCYVVHSTLNDPRIGLSDIFAGALPFAVIMLLVTILLVLVPGLSLALV